MKGDIGRCMAKCLTCQQVKAEHRFPAGKLHSLPILVWKWEDISMNFVVDLPRSKGGHDAIWVIVDRLTKSAHFLPIHTTWSGDKLVQVYLDEIVRLHGGRFQLQKLHRDAAGEERDDGLDGLSG
uniref:Integrase zinc-binding domain-containing protein n=1 Tax=Ananas comosus var. bracteatus TaxID=296719 RepID=A0A6V7P970_ANACO|nr:unnamed protein product [Ananas comosus var. bracteatus]